MSRYIVTPIILPRGYPQYIVYDTAEERAIGGACGCEAWAQHRADALNDNGAKEENVRAIAKFFDKCERAQSHRTAEDMEKAKWGRNRHGKE